MRYGDPKVIDAITLALGTFRFQSKNLDVKEVAAELAKVLSPEQIPAVVSVLRGERVFDQVVVAAQNDVAGIPLQVDRPAISVQAYTTENWPAVLVDQFSEGGGLKVTRLNGSADLPALEVVAVAQARGACFIEAASASTGPALVLDNRGSADTIVDEFAGARLTSGGIWLDAPSTRDRKDRVEHVSGRRALEALRSLDIPRWRRRGETTKHLSPMLDEFHRAYGIGQSEGVSPKDIGGVALLCAKALLGRVESLERELKRVQAHRTRRPRTLRSRAAASAQAAKHRSALRPAASPRRRV